MRPDFAYLSRALFFCLLIFVQEGQSQTPAQPTFQLGGSNKIAVRNKNDDIVCYLNRDTSVTAHEIRNRAFENPGIKVKFEQQSGCGAQEGFVNASSLRPAGDEKIMRPTRRNTEVFIKPSESSNVGCKIDPATDKMQILDDSQSQTWIKVKLLPAAGKKCPESGFIHRATLQPDFDFQSLPDSKEQVITKKAKTEAGNAECLDGSCEKKQASIKDKVDPLVPALQGSQYLDGLRAMIRNPKATPENLTTSRRLVQIPLSGKTKSLGPCGSHHYLASSPPPPGSDAYANPLTACAFSAMLQEWKKRNPDDSKGTRLSWGDISHAKARFFNSHRTHTDGNCIDIRPMRKGNFEDAGLNFGSNGRCLLTRRNKRGKRVCVRRAQAGLNPNYDRNKTKELIDLAKSMGATKILFNDRACGTKAARGHDNHIHMCFHDNKNVRSTCQNFIPDPQICPEFK